MSRTSARFKQSDVTRALRAARAVSLDVCRVTRSTPSPDVTVIFLEARVMLGELGEVEFREARDHRSGWGNLNHPAVR